MDIKIHINPSQPHQREHGEWLTSGFKRHGLKCEVTADRYAKAGIHIVSGPHYAKYVWINHPRTIWLDKRYYRDDQKPQGMASDPCVSLGWLNKDGGRDFKEGAGREKPEIKDNHGKGTIFLADYHGIIEQADTVRRHHLEESYTETLEEALSRHKTAIGHGTTALVKAGLEGLRIECKAKNSIMYQSNWINLLPYADWNYLEIETGEAWEHLRLSLNQH